ncbi:hypothetical protein DRW03_25665 [Corallococcus sp. H22C18031201]|nr:hypothetical protein [Citreicoccus inhibens]RJS18123.1 hypothetical protein DRW03_25665 [Corallococcus sp. H22C18031201]
MLAVGLLVGCGGAVGDGAPTKSAEVVASEGALAPSCTSIYEYTYYSDATYTTEVGWASCGPCGSMPTQYGRITAYRVVDYSHACP